MPIREQEITYEDPAVYEYLNENDNEILANAWAWAEVGPMKFPLGLVDWKRYEEVFENCPGKPLWKIVPFEGEDDETINRIINRREAIKEHAKALRESISRGEIVPLNPKSFSPERFTIGEPAKSAIVDRQQFIQFAKTFGIAITIEPERKNGVPAQKKAGRKATVAALRPIAREAIENIYAHFPDAALMSTIDIVCHVEFVQKVFPGRPVKTTNAVRRPNDYRRHYGVAQRGMLEVVRAYRRDIQ